MSYDSKLAGRVRDYLKQLTTLNVEEKKMFGGLAFLVDGKMCINVSGNNLMCRFDPRLTPEIAKRKGCLPMVMKGKTYKGYCYIAPIGFQKKNDFEYWLDICLEFNKNVKSSRKFP